MTLEHFCKMEERVKELENEIRRLTAELEEKKGV